MAKRYVKVGKVKLQMDDGESMQLIYGDEVETVGTATGDNAKVKFRGRLGRLPKASIGTNAKLECYFLDVGQGDATLIVTPGRKKILVDGGKGVAAGRTGEAEQALIWKYQLDEANTSVIIDLVVLTHADEDHIGGLINLIKNDKIVVKKVIHSGIATFDHPNADDQLGTRKTINGTNYLTTTHSTLNDLDGTNLSRAFAAWTTVLGNERVDYKSVQAGDVVDIDDPDIAIEVLGPTVEQPAGANALRWFGDKAHTINGHSVVLRLTYDEVSVLLTGDVNIEGAKPILATPDLAAKLDAHVLKAPHHGSHEFAPTFLDAVNPQITSISSGEIPDHGHPRANFLGAVGQRSRSDMPLLFSTALSAVFSTAERSRHQDAVDAQDDSTLADNEVKRDLFQKLLPGIINIRTDGQQIHAATRVQTGYWWVIFFPIEPAPRSLPSP